MKKIIATFFTLVLSRPNRSFAEEAAKMDDHVASTGTKLGCGIENIVTSPAEIPCTIESEMHQGDRIIRFFTGSIKGTIFFLRRALVGATEVGTFFVPMERTISRVCSDKHQVATI